MKNSAFRRALVVPAVLLIGFGGTALAATPALAATAPAVSPAPTTAPAVSPAATVAPAVPTASPTATATPTASPTATPTATATASPAPRPARSAAAPTDLTLTSPNPNQVDPIRESTRTITLTGTAPVGSVLTLSDNYDWSQNPKPLTSITTTATTFTFTYTLGATDPYEQFFELSGKHGSKDLTPVDFVVDFPPIGTSATPTLDQPATGATYTKGLLPFGLSIFAKPVTFSGTGTPGDDISLDFAGSATPANPASLSNSIFDGGGLQASDIVVDDQGKWTGSGFLAYGVTSVTAAQVQLGGADSVQPVTQLSPATAAIVVTTKLPAGTILSPSITKPAYPDSGFAVVGGGSSTATSVQASSAALESKVALRMIRSSGAVKPSRLVVGKERAARLRAEFRGEKVAASSVAVSTDATSSGSDDAASVVSDGIQVAGTPNQEAPGFLTTTVSGLGTPGDGIVLSFQPANGAQAYFTKLYPVLFASVSGNTNTLPSLSDDPGTVTSLLPADDHTIVVGADGRWTTTVTLKPGPYFLTAFQTSPAASATPKYSVAGDLLPVNLTGKPYIAPATVGKQLAFTGSNSQPATGIALAAIIAGASLLVVARRRRQE